MALVGYVEDKVYQEALGSPQVANLLRAIFNSPEWAKSFVALAAIQMSKLALSPAERELVILQTGALFGAEYVWAQHVGISEAIGISQEQRDAIRAENYAAPVFSQKQSALLRFVDDLAQRRYDAGVLDELKAHFTDQELIEIVGLHGFAYTVASMTSAFRIEVDPVSGKDLLRFVEDVAPPRP